MKKILLSIILLYLQVFANSNIKAYAIGIFDKNGNGENIQHLRKTKSNYDGLCYSKVIVLSKSHINTPQVTIGNSRGHFIKSIPIYNKYKIKMAEEFTFKHFNVTRGYFEVKIDGKLYDTKVFIK
ncbi:hypothetical protein [Arcobacter sp. YIC-80]|uniref:hypothetical protein n=1 Tax=unclassified Arcobacter TaxID=2593671 RepID=UPI00384B7E40